MKTWSIGEELAFTINTNYMSGASIRFARVYKIDMDVITLSTGHKFRGDREVKSDRNKIPKGLIIPILMAKKVIQASMEESEIIRSVRILKELLDSRFTSNGTYLIPEDVMVKVRELSGILEKL